jgi:hypothetical protein
MVCDLQEGLVMADVALPNEDLVYGGDRLPPPRFDAADDGGLPDDDELLELMGQADMVRPQLLGVIFQSEDNCTQTRNGKKEERERERDRRSLLVPSV